MCAERTRPDPDSKHTSGRRLYDSWINICKTSFLERLLISNTSLRCQMSCRHKMFMLQNVCLPFLKRLSVVFTAFPFQDSRSLADIIYLCHLVRVFCIICQNYFIKLIFLNKTLSNLAIKYPDSTHTSGRRLLDVCIFICTT